MLRFLSIHVWFWRPLKCEIRLYKAKARIWIFFCASPDSGRGGGFDISRFTYPCSLNLVEPFSTISCSTVDRQQVRQRLIRGIALLEGEKGNKIVSVQINRSKEKKKMLAKFAPYRWTRILPISKFLSSSPVLMRDTHSCESLDPNNGETKELPLSVPKIDVKGFMSLRDN